MSRIASNTIIIVVAPSGAGKSSFVDRITLEMPVLRDTVTYTTRQIRKGESEGSPYHFVNQEEFQQKIKSGFFVEWAEVHGNLYGTPMHQIEEAWAQGQAVIMDIDFQGARTFKQKFPKCHTIFILPPSLEELRRRIVGRDGKVPHDLELRLSNAKKEIALANEFDYRQVNDDFETSFQQFKKIIEDLLKSK